MTIDQVELHEPSQPMPRFISIREAAAFLGRTDRTLRRWIADGTLPLIQLGRGKFILVDDVQALIRDQIADQAMRRVTSKQPNRSNSIEATRSKQLDRSNSIESKTSANLSTSTNQ